MVVVYCSPLTQVGKPAEVTNNTYLLYRGEGYPSILYRHLPNAIRDVEKTQKFHILAVVLDADEQTVHERERQVYNATQQSDVPLQSARLEVIVQNRCLETWLLGNRRIFVRHPQSAELRNYIYHFDVHQNDPEEMPIHENFNSHSQFHLAYLKSIFRERSIAYTKTRPGHAEDLTYFNQLITRVNESPRHMPSFSHFLALCRRF